MLQVEGVHRLAVFQHHKVGDVHNVVNGPHPAGPQPLPHPPGGGGNFYVLHHPGHIPGAEGAVLYLHPQVIVDIPAAALYHRGRGLHRQAEGGGSLPGQAQDREAVGAVGGDFKLHRGVVKADGGLDIFAQNAVAILPQDEDAVFDGVGEIVGGEAQFPQGAEHPAAFHPPQLALGDFVAPREHRLMLCHWHKVPCRDVLGPGDNLHRFSSHIHLADPQVVGIGVALHGLYLAHHHVLYLGALYLVPLHLGAGHGHPLAVRAGSQLPGG